MAGGSEEETHQPRVLENTITMVSGFGSVGGSDRYADVDDGDRRISRP